MPSQRVEVAAILAAAFLAETGRGLVISTLTPCIYRLHGSTTTVGIAVSLYSLGRLLSAVPLGHIMDRLNSTRTTLQLACLLSAATSLVYALVFLISPGKSTAALAVLCAARFGIGFGSGILGVVRSYLVKITASGAERTRAITYSGLVQYVGFSVTPLVPVIWNLLSPPPDDANAADAAEREVSVVNCAMPGYFMFVLNLILAVGLQYGMNIKDPVATRQVSPVERLSRRERQRGSQMQDMSVSPEKSVHSDVSLLVGRGGEDADDTVGFVTPSFFLKMSTAVYFGVNFAVRGIVGVAETIQPTEFERITLLKADLVLYSSLYFACLGIVGLVVFVLITPAQKWLDKWCQQVTNSGYRPVDMEISRVGRSWRPMFINTHCIMEFFGVGLLILGSLLLTETLNGRHLVPYTVGMLMVWSLASPVCQTVVIVAFSEMLNVVGEHMEFKADAQMGKLMGSLTTAGSIGRIALPALASAMPYDWANLTSAAICLACLLAVLLQRWYATHLL